MGVFTSALDGAIKGAQQAMMDNLQTENALFRRYVNLLSYGANLYRAIAEGQLVSAAKHYGNYQAARVLFKEYCSLYPEEDKKFIPLKKKFVEEYVSEKYNTIRKTMAEDGHDKAYALVSEIMQGKMDFITPEQVIAEAMDELAQNPSPNYVTSPFGSSAPQEEKKEKGLSWLFGKK